MLVAGAGLVIPGVGDSHVHAAELGASHVVADLTAQPDDRLACARETAILRVSEAHAPASELFAEDAFSSCR